jgi:competence protein ComEA
MHAILLLYFIVAPAFAAPVDINSADAQTIADALNGIGIKKAQAIIEYRTKNGDFKTLQELDAVTGIGEKTLARIERDVVFNTPKPPKAESPAPKLTIEWRKTTEIKQINPPPEQSSPFSWGFWLWLALVLGFAGLTVWRIWQRKEQARNKYDNITTGSP